MEIGTRARGLVTLAVSLAAAACGSSGPRPLAFGAEQCAHCHMTLADPRFAGELVTVTGKVIPFDDVGCLASFVASGGVSREQIGTLWVSDFAHPDSLLEVHQAVFLRSDSLQTPMDYRVVALRPGRTADSARAALGGELLSWDQVVRLVVERPGR
jgi:copper chaperone NosL